MNLSEKIYETSSYCKDGSGASFHQGVVVLLFVVMYVVYCHNKKIMITKMEKLKLKK